MIISHKYKYVFIEVPRTGSTAISAELEKHYGGERILSKHSYYSTFLNAATDAERNYTTISGIRNPLDDVVSVYKKYSTKPISYYSDNRRNMRKHKLINTKSMTFSEYLRQFHTLPYDHWTSTYHHKFDHVIRFESIQEDFSKAIQLIGANQERPLPEKNRTDRERDFCNYYTNSDIDFAVWIFGPYMRLWGYEFPDRWQPVTIPRSSQVLFNLLRWPRRIYWNNIRQSHNLVARLFQKFILE